MRTVKDRILAAWNGQSNGYAPLTTWCFGFKPPQHLRWHRNGREVTFWYSKRMEHIHTLPQSWELEDDFQRALTWEMLGIEDILEISVPWGIGPEVTYEDFVVPASGTNPQPVITREYHTPSGILRHAIRQTGEEPGEGWVIQPSTVPLFEDYNIPRAAKHAVSSPAEVPIIRHLYQSPDSTARSWFTKRMEQVKRFADDHGFPVQAWSAFGMDAVVWLMGAEGAVLMALDQPQAFQKLVDIVFEADYGRTELACSTPGVDMVVQRGWYSSTDFWSPKMFNSFVYPHLAELSTLAHQYGKKFGYVITTGVERLGPRLADAGVDVLFFIDPIQDRISLEKARDVLGDRMTLVGGINAISLKEDPHQIRQQVQVAMKILAPTNRFILHPVDALFPDTPWSGVEAMIKAWKEFQT